MKIDIRWIDRKLEKNCRDDRRGQRHWGADQWQLLKKRLISIAAAAVLQDLRNVPGRFHPLSADRSQEFALCLWGQYRLVFVADNDPLPLLADGGIDQTRVTSVAIKEVVDYHG
jgi:proteic killer suppression protein